MIRLWGAPFVIALVVINPRIAAAAWDCASAVRTYEREAPQKADYVYMLRLIVERKDACHELARESLDRLGPHIQSVVDRLIDDVEHASPIVPLATTNTLYHYGPLADRAATALKKRLADPLLTPFERYHLAHALASMRPKAAIGDLRKCIWPDSDHATKAVEALAQIGADASPAIPELIRFVEKRRGHESRPGIVALQKIGPPAESALPLLEKRLASSIPEVRIDAAHAMSAIDPRQANKVARWLVRDTRHTNPQVREHALLALSDVAKVEPRYIRDIAIALDDDDKFTSATALRALVPHGAKAKRARARLVKIYETEPNRRHDAGLLLMAIDGVTSTTALALDGVRDESHAADPLAEHPEDGRELDETPTVLLPRSKSRITALGAGAWHVCFLFNGKVYCRGANNHGQLGTKTKNDRSDRFLPVRGIEHATLLAVGWRANCALDGARVKCWGAGYGAEPVVIPHVQNVHGLAVGDSEGYAIAEEYRGLLKWNSREHERALQAQWLNGADEEVSRVDAHGLDLCAVIRGRAQCLIQLPRNEDRGPVLLFRDLIEGSGPASWVASGDKLASGHFRNCAVIEGLFVCGATTGKRLEVEGISGELVDEVYGAHTHMCVVQGGALRCVGSNSYGQSRPCQDSPRHNCEDSGSHKGEAIRPLMDGVGLVALGSHFTCATRGKDELWCSGLNLMGALGRETKSRCDGQLCTREAIRVFSLRELGRTGRE